MANNNKMIRKNATDLAKLILTTKYGVGGTVLKLIELLSDKDQAVREQVIETIINMGDPGLENIIRAFVSEQLPPKALEDGGCNELQMRRFVVVAIVPIFFSVQ